MIVAIDSNSCNIRDTAYRYVIGRTDKAILDFKYKKVGTDCRSLDYEFQNTSQAPSTKPFTDNSFLWSFSDLPSGTRIPDKPVGSPLNHSFSVAGTYIVKLLLVDTAYCNYPDTVTKTVRVSPVAKAQFVTQPTGCAPYMASFDNTSLGGLDFIWDFGDGSPLSTDPVPTHLYANPGQYTITLIVNDSTTCNKTDTTHFPITVSGRPTAGFTFAPAPPVANTPISFTNNSVGGVQFIWHFGDLDSTVRDNMDTVMHLYNSTDTFDVCLIAINQFGCTDTVCKPVATLINPLLDVPNAFTPGRFGQNGVVKVVGFGITKMLWRIYNRWGQLVYQSNDPYFGWDGTYQGVLQPMDVYGYTLEAEFFDGKHVSKKGDITLVR
jgi:gliding motility-associated-like protein